MRYYAQDIPPSNQGAFMPVPAISPSASSGGLCKVYSLMNNPVPAPGPVALPALSADPSQPTQPSKVSPDVITPDQYWPGAENMHAPVAIKSTNELPVPTINPIRVARAVQTRPGSTRFDNFMAWPAQNVPWTSSS